MALTITKVSNADYVSGNKKVRVRDVTFDSSYPTGGEPLAASDVGLRKITYVHDATAKTSDGAAAVPTRYDYTNSKLQGYEYNGASAGVARLQELANAFDASTFSVRLRIEGF